MAKSSKKPKQSSAPLTEDLDLEVFFTDVEHLRDLFRDLLSAEILPKRLLIVHGVGGIGKSTLLRMYRLYCKRHGIGVALVSGDEVRSPVDVLHGFVQDLTHARIKLPHFARTYNQYRAIHARVEEQNLKDARGKAVDILGKACIKTTEAAAGSLFGAVVGSAVPGIGTAVGTAVGGVVGSMSGEAFHDWLRGFLRKSEVDLYLDPAGRFTQDFLDDLAQVADKHRLVLMLDTYEQMNGLDEWVRNLVRELPRNVLTVIAGRDGPREAWDRAWPSWQAQACIEALDAMAEAHMRTLVGRYYATMRGGEPDPTQVDEIVSFSRGLPLVVTSAVRLWVRQGIQDFRAVKPQAVADLVDRLLEGTPKDMRPALEAAAVLRWFNKELLRAILPEAQIEDVYDEIRRFPFVRSRAEGLSLHTVVREMMDENLEIHDPDRHLTLHQRAALYFEEHLHTVPGAESKRLELEQLYHRVRADENTGLRLFQDMAEELVRYQLIDHLRALLNEVKTYRFAQTNSCIWWDYYNARLGQLEARLADAEQVFRTIAENQEAEPRLRAYCLCDLGQVLARYERMSKPEGMVTALSVLESSLQVMPQLDSKLVFVYTHLREVFNFRGELVEATKYPEQQLRFFRQQGDNYGVVYTLGLLNISYGVIGDWRKAFDAVAQGVAILAAMPENRFLRARLLAWGPFAYIWSGHYAESEQMVRDALNWQVGDLDLQTGLARYLTLILGLQGKYKEAHSYFLQASTGYESLGMEYVYGLAVLQGFWGATLVRQGDLAQANEYLSQSLSFKRQVRDEIGIPELLNSLGAICEVKAQQEPHARGLSLKSAEDYYNQSLGLQKTNRYYFHCGALAGLMRAKYAQGDYVAIPSVKDAAEQLAQKYEYNDYLAALRLTQGHIAWDCSLSDWGTGFEATLIQYQQALVHALRFNRFLLDEVLWGGGICTPLDAIVPHCQARGDEGRRMLEALWDWWQTGTNDVGKPRLDTISPIPEGIPLLEAEGIARERERGDSMPQQTVQAKLAQYYEGFAK